MRSRGKQIKLFERNVHGIFQSPSPTLPGRVMMRYIGSDIGLIAVRVLLDILLDLVNDALDCAFILVLIIVLVAGIIVLINARVRVRHAEMVARIRGK